MAKLSPADALAYLGIAQLKPAQKDVIDAMETRDDVLAILPTGFGKSLCYQLPALTSSGVTLVISPLLSLMRDQVSQLQARGVNAAMLASDKSDDDILAAFRAAAKGVCKLLYMSPEYLSKHYILRTLQDLHIARVVIDEVHTVSEWGHDFREDYLNIRKAVARLGDVPMAGFTATASPIVLDDLKSVLFKDRTPRVFHYPVLRANIHHEFVEKTQPRMQLLALFEAAREERALVYVGTRKRAETLADALVAAGYRAVGYHAGLDNERRRIIEQDFQTGVYNLVVATNAFGMGVDIPDIRLVVHADFPPSPENYLQEIGRAGRDGERARALCFVNADDIEMRRAQIAATRGDDTQKALRFARLEALVDIASSACIDQSVAAYFGEDIGVCGDCGACQQGALEFRHLPQALSLFADDEGAKTRFEALLSMRNQIFRDKGLVMFRALPDALLAAIARQSPQSLDELAAIDGIGETRMQKYGEAILRALGAKAQDFVASRTRKQLALKGQGALYDRLSERLADKQYGADGFEKPLQMSSKLIARIVEAAPPSLQALSQVRGMDEARMARYGALILEELSRDDD